MAGRPIDGNELLDIERLLDTDVVRQSKTASWLIDQVLYDIQVMPTLTPPNEWVSDENFNQPLEKQYECTGGWKVSDPKTRPFKFSNEMEDWEYHG